jgi:hypothetical protein
MASQMNLDSKLLTLACQQQGLIHLYKNFCVLGKCRECCLSR